MRRQKVGGRDYWANIDAIIPILQGQAMADAVKDAADVIAERARGLAPVISGAYRDSIEVTMDEHPTRVVAHIGPTVFYGNTVEKSRHVMRRALG